MEKIPACTKKNYTTLRDNSGNIDTRQAIYKYTWGFEEVCNHWVEQLTLG